MEMLTQLLITGIAVGSIYSLVGLGLIAIYKASGVFNFAVGDLVMLSAFIMWSAFMGGSIHPVFAIVITLAVMAGLGLFIHRIIIRPLAGQDLLMMVICTLALSYCLQGIATAIWSNRQLSFPQNIFPASSFKLWDLTVSWPLLGSFIVATILFGLLSYLFMHTRIGLQMRALHEDTQLGQASGISANRTIAATWVIGGIVAAFGGILLGTMSGVHIGIGQITLALFPAVLLGGLESIAGAFVGGIIVGILQTLSGGYIDPLVGGGAKDVVPFILLVFVLLFRPYGLFGIRKIERI